MHDTTTSVPARPTPDARGAAPQAGIQGYDRAAVDRYLACCAQERASLERELDATRARIARARVALDAQRVLTSMVSEVCSEISAKRRQADLVVARIAKAGLDVEPEAALRGRPAPAPSTVPAAGPNVPGIAVDSVPEPDGATAIRWRAADAVAVR